MDADSALHFSIIVAIEWNSRHVHVSVVKGVKRLLHICFLLLEKQQGNIFSVSKFRCSSNRLSESFWFHLCLAKLLKWFNILHKHTNTSSGLFLKTHYLCECVYVCVWGGQQMDGQQTQIVELFCWTKTNYIKKMIRFNARRFWLSLQDVRMQTWIVSVNS